MSDNKKDTKEKSTFAIEKTLGYFIVSIIITTIAAMIIWPILELLFSKIDGSTYTWTWLNGIVQPFVFSIVVTLIEFIGWDFFHKQK